MSLRTDSDSATNAGVAAGGWKHDPVLRGTGFGILSALAYTGANMALKQVARPSDLDWSIWVSCLKAVPAALAAWMIIGYRATRHLPALPPRRMLLPLLMTGLFMQFGGNVMFQWALGLGGLALSVPLMFAVLILSGALIGRMVLGEGITHRSLAAMGMMILSIVCLSSGAERATAAIVADYSTGAVIGAVLAASLAGIAYGSCGVMIRRTVTRDVSLSATLVLLSSSGVVGLGLLSLYRLGFAALWQTSPADLLTILAAGLFNAIAFFSVSAAYKQISVVRVNLLNASQAAMAAVAGVFWFGEQTSGGLILGTSLAVAGLLLVEGRAKAKRVESGSHDKKR